MYRVTWLRGNNGIGTADLMLYNRGSATEIDGDMQPIIDLICVNAVAMPVDCTP